MTNELIALGHLAVVITALLTAFHLGVHALIGLLCVFTVLMNMFVIKQIALLGLTVTATDAYAVAIMLGLNLIQEYWGQDIAQKTIVSCFFTALISLVLSMIHLAYVPHLTDASHEHFFVILHTVPRIVAASLATYLLVLQANVWLYEQLKQRWPTASLVLRNYASIGITQFIDTVLFSFLGLWGLVSSIGHVILFSYSIKVLTLVIATPFVGLSKRFFRL